MISANSKAKRCGVKTGSTIVEGCRLWPRIALVPQRPDLYVRTHQRIVAAILDVLPIGVICLIDALAAFLENGTVPKRSLAGSSVACGMPSGSTSPVPSVAQPIGGLAQDRPPTSTSRTD